MPSFSLPRNDPFKVNPDILSLFISYSMELISRSYRASAYNINEKEEQINSFYCD